MKYDAWRRALNIQEEFQKSLYQLVKIFDRIAKVSGSDQDKYTQGMKEFQESYQFEKFVYSAVRRMVTPLAVGNMNTWRRAARKSSQSLKMYNLLINEINEGLKQDINSQIISNAELIRTLPTDVARKVVFDIKDYTFEGMRAEAIADLIRDKTNQHAGASARLIARTEVSKTTTALTRARAENLGLNWYVWRTEMDGDRVRKSHRIMEGVIVNWNNPPSPEQLAKEKSEGYYHAGEIWNCRCYPEPLIEIDDVKWPHKVYYMGKIKTMSRREFEQIG